MESEMVKKLMPTVVPQTKVAFAGFSLLFMSMIVNMILQKSFDVRTAIGIVFTLLLIILSLYVLNCTVVGGCKNYAWIAGYFVLALGILMVFTVLLNLFKGNSGSGSGKSRGLSFGSAKR